LACLREWNSADGPAVVIHPTDAFTQALISRPQADDRQTIEGIRWRRAYSPPGTVSTRPEIVLHDWRRWSQKSALQTGTFWRMVRPYELLPCSGGQASFAASRLQDGRKSMRLASLRPMGEATVPSLVVVLALLIAAFIVTPHVGSSARSHGANS